MSSTSNSFSPVMAPPESFSLVSSSSKNKIKFNWKIDKFNEAVELAGEMSNLVQILGMFVNSNGAQISIRSLTDVSWFQKNKGKVLIWSLRTHESAHICFGVADRRCTTNGNKVKRIVGGIDIIGTVSVSYCLGNQTLPLFTGGQFNLNKSVLWNLFKMNQAQKYLSEDGSLRIEVEFSTHVLRPSDKQTTCLAGEDSVVASVLEETIRDNVARSVAALLGDEKTSDIRILIKDNDKVLGSFFCHSKILSSRSSVFCAMLENNGMVEKEKGVVEVSDISVQVMDQFLSFLYCGHFKDKRESGKDKPAWVEMLPDLVYVADKYDVKDLMKFCDLHLSRAITQDNVEELLQVANLHRLHRAEVNIRAKLDKKARKNK